MPVRTIAASSFRSTDYSVIDRIYHKMQNDLDRMMPDATVNVKKFALGPAAGGKIQLRINGPDTDVLRTLADKAMAVMEADPGIKALRSEWGAKVKVVQPVIAEDRARRQGIDRQMVAQAIQSNFAGTTTGVYREGIELIPIIARAPAANARPWRTCATSRSSAPRRAATSRWPRWSTALPPSRKTPAFPDASAAA